MTTGTDDIFVSTLRKFAENYRTAVLPGEEAECDEYADQWIRSWQPPERWPEYRAMYEGMKNEE